MAASVGATMYGLARFSYWFDEAFERALRRRGVTHPRVVMAVVLAAFHLVNNEIERHTDQPTPDERQDRHS